MKETPMSDVGLPDDPIEFEKSLSNRLKRIDKAIKESLRRERRDLSRRIEVIEEYREKYQERRTLAASLALQKETDEIDALLKELEGKHKALSSRLDKLSPDDEDEQPRAEAPMAAEQLPSPPEPEPEPEPALAPEPRVTVDHRLPKIANPLLDPAELKSELEQLVGRADSLVHGAGALEVPELKRRVELLAFEGRLAQAAHPALRDNDSDFGKEIRRFFGRLSRICQDELFPHNEFVFGLKQDHQADWAAKWINAVDELDVWLDNRRQEAEERRRREEAERQRKQREEADQKHALEMLGELRNLMEQKDANPDEHPDWESEMVALAREVVTHAPEIPDDLVELVTPWAEMFQGPVFRRFRRELQRRGLIEPTASGRHAAVPALPELPAEEEVPANRAAESLQYWRGRGKGQMAVVVGGTKRDHAVRRIKAFFEFDEVEWVSNERSERAPADRLAERIRNGNVGVLFFLARFSGHAIQDKLKPACHEAGVPFVCVEHGYGLPQLCLALEATGHYAEEAMG
jgi:hypothetical protein